MGVAVRNPPSPTPTCCGGCLDPRVFWVVVGQVQLDTAAARSAGTAGPPPASRRRRRRWASCVWVNATMERALRAVSVEQGHDPRSFTLLPFGGAGPLHACELAHALGMTRILMPAIPGVLSAYGMLVADTSADAAQSVLSSLASLAADPSPLAVAAEMLAAKTRRTLGSAGVLACPYRGRAGEDAIELDLTPALQLDVPSWAKL